MSLRFLLNHNQEEPEDSGAVAQWYLRGESGSPGHGEPSRSRIEGSRSPDGVAPGSPATLLGKRKAAARDDESGTEGQSPGSECTAWSNPASQVRADDSSDRQRARSRSSLLAEKAGFPGQAATPSARPQSRSANSMASSTSQGSTQHDSICYGMLHRVDVKLLGDLTETSKQLDALRTSEGYIVLSVSEQADHVLVSFSDGGPLGYLRSHMKDALGPLLRQKDMEFDVLVEIAALQETIIKARKTAGVVLDTDVYLYGPARLAPMVGERLSQWKLWLQRPGRGRPGAAYENPHFFVLDKMLRRKVMA
ncbi:hypothetical protein F5X68DRAFT_50134 [Plectosphaerella plurivora]|uniref:Uncharacterized protein n=1 Tax=Plectosphaerella plurivora TaxID=936078 RepID=A0A9P8V3S7_9PEZI|nr:hypothetical protein F5X68DRAFT_50134 [Plectosphaerella plurivora]